MQGAQAPEVRRTKIAHFYTGLDEGLVRLEFKKWPQLRQMQVSYG